MNDMVQPENMARIGLAEIIPLKTATLPPYTTTNAVFYGNRSFVVIDPGPAHENQRRLLETHLQRRKSQGHQFLAICLTHHHGDHTGAADFIAKRFSVPIIAHTDAAKVANCHVDQAIDNGEEIRLDGTIKLTALHTPGHAESHLVFYDESHQVLIAGDMVTDRGTILIPPGTGSLRVYLESLDELTKLDIKTLIPAHGCAVTEQPRTFLLKAMRHRYERILAVLDRLLNTQSGLLDATDITLLVYRNNIAENLLAFAQLSVESSLHWLLEMGLIKNTHHKWQALRNVDDIKTTCILSPLKQIDERLRHS